MKREHGASHLPLLQAQEERRRRARRPVYYFEFDHDRKAAKAYCDVGEALQAELGVGPYQPAES